MSCDMFLGVPFNLSFYSLLLIILAKLTNKKAKMVTWTGGDCHIYSNHSKQVDKIIDNYMEFNNNTNYYNLNKQQILKFDPKVDFTNLDTFLETTLDNPERIFLYDYHYKEVVKAPVAV